MEQIYPGIWKITLGEPEAATPVSLRNLPPAITELTQFDAPASPPVAPDAISGTATTRGFVVKLPLAETEQVYGLGLQLMGFNHKGKKRTLRVNSDPIADLGDSHAPVPFYVTTSGYGVLIDTARYATFYCGALQPHHSHAADADAEGYGKVQSAEELYSAVTRTKEGGVIVEVPFARGVDVYLFAGPAMREAVQRYNLFSGGGCVPPRWGLGVWYRCAHWLNQEQVLEIADTLRADTTPCDVFGLEPGWQTHAYSCSFLWSEKFPNPKQLVDDLRARHFQLNLWTHVFTHPTSPIYPALEPYSGDYDTFFDGLVPDLTIPHAREIFADFHAQQHIDLGVSGYKLDECDNSDFVVNPWSFPELSRFPSGMDGEQMHSLLGINYQETIDGIFRARNRRTYSAVRNSHALAAPYPFVLYSDLYKHEDFIRGLVNSGFSGLLWTPEVRDALSEEDLIRRLQSVVFSPQALINAWYIINAPWKQMRMNENNAGQFLENAEELTAACRAILELRMRFIPYLYAAFHRYRTEGMPPFRALVMDYPQDEQVWTLDTQYMMGDRVMVAPITAGATERVIYLPAGEWVDFWTGRVYQGQQSLTYPTPLEIIPLFVKNNSVLPLADPTLHTEDPASMRLTVHVYGDGSLPCTLVEDDGVSYDYSNGHCNRLTVAWDAAGHCETITRTGNAECPRYECVAWHQVNP